MNRFSRERKPLSLSQMKIQIAKLETRLETEALKFSEEKKIRGQVRDMKKKAKKLASSYVARKKVAASNNSNRGDKPEFDLKPNIGQLIKNDRMKRGMNQEQFASFISERLSILQKWEIGSMNPSIDVARRLQKKLGITLLEKVGSESEDKDAEKMLESIVSSGRKKEATLGDMIKIKTRKR